MQPVLHPAVHVPQAQGALVEGVLGQPLLRDVEHLSQGGVVPEVLHRPVLRVRIYGAGDDLHHGQLSLQAVEAVGEQELHQSQPVGRRAADDLRPDDAGVVVRHLAQTDGHYVAATGSQGLFQAAARLYFRGSLRMEVTPVGIELHGIIIDARIIAHAAAATQYHLLQQSPQFLAASLCVSRQFAEAHDRALADLAIRIAPVL